MSTFRTYNPQLAELMNELEKKPNLPTTLKTFGDIVSAMRTTHSFAMTARSRFEKIYSEAVHGGKYTMAGLRDMKEDFEDFYKSLTTSLTDFISEEIEKWKGKEQRNTYAVVSKAPSDEQAKLLNAILTRNNISLAEVELWAKHFGDNYVCSCSFRDYAEKLGYLVIYSDFTDAEERIETVEKAYTYVKDLLRSINTADKDLSYPQLVFYGIDEDTGTNYANTYVDDYICILDSDSTFKADQKIEVKRKDEGQDANKGSSPDGEPIENKPKVEDRIYLMPTK